MKQPSNIHSFRGVWAASLTPIKEDLTVDEKRLTDHVQWLLKQGCHGVVVGGSTGEANSFSVSERRRMLDAVVESGIEPASLMIGTGCCALPDTVELTSHALQCGCTRVLMLPPFYYKNVSDTGLVWSISELVDRIANPDLRIFLYHFPKASTVPFTFQVVDQLVERFADVINGIKDSTADWSSTRALMERYPSLAVVPGTEALLWKTLDAGGVGCISASANINARGIRAVYDLYQRSPPEAELRQQSVTLLREAIQIRPLIPTLKRTIAEMKDDRAWLRMRPPFIPVAPELEDQMRSALVDATILPPAGS